MTTPSRTNQFSPSEDVVWRILKTLARKEKTRVQAKKDDSVKVYYTGRIEVDMVLSGSRIRCPMQFEARERLDIRGRKEHLRRSK